MESMPPPTDTQRSNTESRLAERGMRAHKSEYETNLLVDRLSGWRTVKFQPYRISLQTQVMARCRELMAVERLESRSKR